MFVSLQATHDFLEFARLVDVQKTDLFDGVLPFVVITETGSFQRAAKALGVTTSAVSKAIARLEAEVGLRLLHRTSRAVTPTAEGEEFLEACRGAVAALRAARARLDTLRRAPRGRLRVSLPNVLATKIVCAMPALLAKHPELSFDIVTTDRFVQLREERIDVALRIGALDDSTDIVRKLRAVELVTCASRRYLARHGTPKQPADLAGHACLTFALASGTTQPWLFRARGGPRPMRVEGALRIDGGETLLAGARAGLGILQAPDVMIATELERGELVPILRAWSVPGPPLSVLIAAGRQRSPNVRVFLELVRSCLASPS